MSSLASWAKLRTVILGLIWCNRKEQVLTWFRYVVGVKCRALFAGRHQLLVAIDCLGNPKFAYSASLKMFLLFVRKKGCNDMKQSVLS